MAAEIKSVIIDLETKISGNGIEQVSQNLKGADNLALRLQKTLKDVSRIIDQSSKNKSLIPNSKNEVKDLKELEKALKLTAKSYDTLSVEQKKALDQLITKQEQYNKSVLNSNQTQKEQTKGLEQHLRGINVLLPVLGQHGVAISLVVSNYLEYIQAQKRGEAGTTTFGTALNLLKNKWVLLGTAISTVLGISANEYFRNTQDGADKLDEAIGGLQETGRGLIGVFVLMGRILTTNPFSKEAKELGIQLAQLFKDLASGKLFEEGAGNARELDAIGDATSKLELEVSKLNLQLLEAREIISEEAKSLDDIAKKQKALNDIKAQEPIIAAKNEELAKRRFSAELQRVAFLQRAQGVTPEKLRAEVESGNVTSANNTQRAALITARKEVDLARAESLRTNIRLNKLEKSVAAEQKALTKEYQDITDGLIETSKQLELADPFGLGKLIKEEDKILAQDRLEKGFKAISEQIKRQSEILGVENILTLTPAQISSLERKYNLVGGTIFNSILRGLESQGNIVDAILDIGSRETPKATDLLKNITKGLPDITKQIREAVNNTKLENQPQQEKASLFERFFAVTPEERQQVKDTFAEAANQLKDGIQAFYDAEIAKTDFLISEQEKRIEETSKLAELGNAEQLQLEKARLNDLLEERRQAVEAQKAINAIEIVSNTLLTASSFAAALAKDALIKSPLVAIASGIALVASIAAGIAQLSALGQGFETGTESVQPNGKSKRGKSDTIPAWLAKDERVVPANINAQIGDIPNRDLPKFIAAGKLAMSGHGIFKADRTIEGGISYKEMVDLMKLNNRELGELKHVIGTQMVDIQFDYHGYTIQQRRAKRLSEKVNKAIR